MCLPAFEPYKICKLMHKHFKDPKDICIVGYPIIDWQGDSQDPLEITARAQQGNYIKALRTRQVLKLFSVPLDSN